jgi:hypothetical protein
MQNSWAQHRRLENAVAEARRKFNNAVSNNRQHGGVNYSNLGRKLTNATLALKKFKAAYRL